VESLAAFLDQYGWLTVLGLYILANAGKIAVWIERLAGRLWPAWAETRRQRQERERERERHERVVAERDRLDTIMTLKDMLLAYRQSLDDAILERRQLQNKLYDIVERYERHDARVVEVLRDISSAIRAQTQRLDWPSARIVAREEARHDEQTTTAD